MRNPRRSGSFGSWVRAAFRCPQVCRLVEAYDLTKGLTGLPCHRDFRFRLGPRSLACHHPKETCIGPSEKDTAATTLEKRRGMPPTSSAPQFRPHLPALRPGDLPGLSMNGPSVIMLNIEQIENCSRSPRSVRISGQVEPAPGGFARLGGVLESCQALCGIAHGLTVALLDPTIVPGWMREKRLSPNAFGHDYR